MLVDLYLYSLLYCFISIGGSALLVINRIKTNEMAISKMIEKSANDSGKFRPPVLLLAVPIVNVIISTIILYLCSNTDKIDNLIRDILEEE